MTLTLDLPADVRDAISKAAQERGKTPEQEALESLRRLYLQPSSPRAEPRSDTDPTLALFALWAEEDATDDPEELTRRNREGDGFMASLRSDRVDFEGRTDFRARLEDQESDAAAA